MKLLCLFLLNSCCFFSLVLNAQSDTALSKTDSMGNFDCYENFFRSTGSVKDARPVMLVLKDGKTTSLTSFLMTGYNTNDNELAPKSVLKDVDGDGKKELVIRNFTGGAHCCDAMYFFKNTAPYKYSFAGKLFAGNSCVDENNNFSYGFGETFGYFFTCFACGLLQGDEKEITDAPGITIQYKNGRLVVVPGTAAEKQTMLKNLAYIKKLGFDGGVKAGAFDDGRRKELALNLAAYYYLFGKNMVATKSLFDTTYPFKDSAIVWKAFLQNLNSIKKENSF